jgi:hypothetical protein
MALVEGYSATAHWGRLPADSAIFAAHAQRVRAAAIDIIPPSQTASHPAPGVDPIIGTRSAAAAIENAEPMTRSASCLPTLDIESGASQACDDRVERQRQAFFFTGILGELCAV